MRALLFVAVSCACAAASLHLDSASDREAFRRWFTFLAESQFNTARPVPEIDDCAALVRWSFRQALTPHDSAWANAIGLDVLPAMPPVRQFAWPRTPAGANLFRTSAISEGQFADATTLRRYNTFFISREVNRALPGDLLFYRQFGRAMAAHVMIWLGNRVVYHTGPSNGGPGEIRELTISDLLAHPAPEWRPVSGNANFLGVWRLNILRDSE